MSDRDDQKACRRQSVLLVASIIRNYVLGRSDRFRIFPAFTSRLVGSPDLQSMRGEGTETVQRIIL